MKLSRRNFIGAAGAGVLSSALPGGASKTGEARPQPWAASRQAIPLCNLIAVAGPQGFGAEFVVSQHMEHVGFYRSFQLAAVDDRLGLIKTVRAALHQGHNTKGSIQIGPPETTPCASIS